MSLSNRLAEAFRILSGADGKLNLACALVLLIRVAVTKWSKTLRKGTRKRNKQHRHICESVCVQLFFADRVAQAGR